jgi:predicted DNA-binding helix-hairpin-helix protein
LRRIYYSAFSPIQRASTRLPNRAPPLIREHRLYQADWLMRYYEFSLGDLAQAMPGGKLDLQVDPKTTWALANRQLFPVDVNTAERHVLLRVPGLGVRIVDRIVSSRRHRRLRYEDLKTMGATLKRARHFLCTADYRPPQGDRNTDSLRRALTAAPQQQSLF